LQAVIRSFLTLKNVDRILMAGVKGGIAGGVFGAPSTIAEAARNKRTDQALIDAEQARRDEVAAQKLAREQALAEEQQRFVTTPTGETAPIFQEGEAPAPLKEQKLESFLSDIAKQKAAKPAAPPTEEAPKPTEYVLLRNELAEKLKPRVNDGNLLKTK